MLPEKNFGCHVHHIPLINTFFNYIYLEFKIKQKIKTIIFYKYIYSNYWKNCLQQILWGIDFFLNYDQNISESTPYYMGIAYFLQAIFEYVFKFFVIFLEIPSTLKDIGNLDFNENV